MVIGNFSYDAHHDIYSGDIATLTLERGGVMFRPNEKGGDKEPDYRVVQEREGGTVELGAAWKRSSGSGREFLSVLLDDPALPGALNAALFFSDQSERATLVWQRQLRKAPVAEAKPEAAEPKPASPRPRRGSAARRLTDAAPS
jgi:uncharacterized protein (DUF736 family)